MLARFFALSASLAGTAGAESDPKEIAFKLTTGNRQSLAVGLDNEQSFVVTSIAAGQAQESGVSVGDRLVSANGESAEKKSNYWMITHFDARPLDIVFRAGSKADQDCSAERLAQVYEYVENSEVVNLRKLLEDYKCDVNQMIEGKHPLMHIAATKGKVAIVRILVFYGAKMDIEFEGSRPLHVAARLGTTFAAHVIADAGAEFDARDAAGMSAFQLACLHGNPEVLKVLRKFKCKWLEPTPDGKTTMEVAREGGHESVLKLMDLMLESQAQNDKEHFSKVLKGEEL